MKKAEKPAKVRTEDEVKKSPKKKAASPGNTTNVKVTEKSYEFEGREFENLNPKDYGIDYDEQPQEYSEYCCYSNPI